MSSISIIEMWSQVVTQEGNDKEDQGPTPTIAWAQILSGTSNPSDQKPKTSLASLQLPQTEENIQTDQLCPNTEWDFFDLFSILIQSCIVQDILKLRHKINRFLCNHTQQMF